MAELLSTPQKLLRESQRARLTSSIEREREAENEKLQKAALESKLMPPPPQPDHTAVPATPPPEEAEKRDEDEEMVDWTRLAEESFDGTRYRRRGLRYIQDEGRREERRRMGRESYARRRNGKKRFETTVSTEGESMEVDKDADAEMMLPEGINDREQEKPAKIKEEGREPEIAALPPSPEQPRDHEFQDYSSTIEEAENRPSSSPPPTSSTKNADKSPLRRNSTKRHQRSASAEKLISPNPPKKKRLSISSASSATTKSWKSRFKEGSMNDRVSKVPPPEVIGHPTFSANTSPAKFPAASTAPPAESGGGLLGGLASMFTFNPFKFVNGIRQSFEKQKREYEKRERERRILKERKKRSQEVYAAVKRGGGFEPTVVMESPGGAWDTAEARRRRSRWESERVKQEEVESEEFVGGGKMSLDEPELADSQCSELDSEHSELEDEQELAGSQSQRELSPETPKNLQARSKSLDASRSSLLDRKGFPSFIAISSSKPASTISSSNSKKGMLGRRSKSLISTFSRDKEERERLKADAASKREAKKQERLLKKIKQLEEQLEKVKGEFESVVGNSSMEGSFVEKEEKDKGKGKGKEVDTASIGKSSAMSISRDDVSTEQTKPAVDDVATGSWEQIEKQKPEGKSQLKSQPKQQTQSQPQKTRKGLGIEDTEENDTTVDEGFSMIPLSPVIHSANSSTVAVDRLGAVEEMSPPPNVKGKGKEKDKGKGNNVVRRKVGTGWGSGNSGSSSGSSSGGRKRTL